MDLGEYARHDALGSAERFRAREVTAKEFAELALQGVEKVNPGLDAVIEVDRDRVATLGDGAPSGSFGGVPMAHANDGWGSTRIPASRNGLVGLECSRGRVRMGPDTSDLTFPLGSATRS